MQEEATQTLASNHFVIVSFEWDGLEIAKHWHGIPIVCEDPKPIARFQHHCMRLHLRYSPKSKRAKGLQSFLIVAADLPQFCGEMMQWAFFNVRSPVPMLTTLRDTPSDKIHSIEHPDASATAPAPVSTKIQLRSVVQPMTAALETSLLKPLENMILGLQKVQIIGSVLTNNVDALTTRMGPRVVWLEPMAWRALEVAQDIKRRRDLFVTQGELSHAVAMYQITSYAQQACRLFHLPQKSFNSDSELPIALLQREILDSAVTQGFLQLKLGSVHGASICTVTVARSRDFLQNLPTQSLVLPDEGKRMSCYQGARWFHLVMNLIMKRDAQWLGVYISHLSLVRSECGEWPNDQDFTARLEHDIKVMQNIRDRREVSDRTHFSDDRTTH